MTPVQNNILQALRERIQLMLSNRLTYPQTLLEIARDRPLTKTEIQKASECLEACRRFVDAELALLAANHGDQFKITPPPN